ncbi:hypothetical protein [Solicola sp. PLA-1-18]|uniref:hypothetical protein n=1 Tax=Solicola sp. PLA-1-18 TaxID=3380532 RepID=UPI003B78C936
MTQVSDRVATEAGRRVDRRARPVRARRSPLASGWWPVLAVWLVTWALLRESDVRDVDVLRFSAYAALGLALPGTLLWRMLVVRGRRPLYADVAFGTALAYSVEMFVYLGVRAVGVPRLLLLWPLLVVLVSLLPALRRRCWRPAGVVRTSPVLSWSLGGVVAFAVVWLWWFIWPVVPVTGVGLRNPYPDVPYHLGLIGELRHHVPGELPMVAGEPLQYHWFVHAEMAATSWGSGVDPLILFLRLSPLLMTVIAILAAGALASRLARTPWAGLVAAVALVVVAPNGVENVGNPQLLAGYIYLSPTQSYALAVSAVLLAAVVEVLGRRRVGAGLWVVFAIAVAGTSGAKGTFLPILVGALLGALLLALVWKRSRVVRLVVMLVLSVVALLTAQRLVYGTGAQGLVVDPLHSNTGWAEYYGLGLSTGERTLATFAYLVSNLGYVLGVWGLVRRRRWRDPRAVFLLGFVVAGVGATLFFWHASLSQMYFLRSVPVAAAVVSAWGLALVAPRRWTRPLVTAVVAALAVGLLVTYGVTRWRVSAGGPGAAEGLLVLLGCTVAVVVVSALVGGVALARRGHGRRFSLLAVAAAAGVALSSVPMLVHQVAETPERVPFVQPDDTPDRIAAGGIPAARWLRDHSSPDDLVATNTHCIFPGQSADNCDNRRFWMSAFSERRYLVEGWAYSPRTAPRGEALGLPNCCLPFWDPEKLRVNDAAFTDPSASTVDRLRDRYDVRWLFVDLKGPDVDLDELARFADLRLERGGYAVLEVR